MPYLHWETDLNRAKAADIVRRTTKTKWSTLDDVVAETENYVVETTFDRVNYDVSRTPGLMDHVITSRTIQGPRSRTIQGWTLLG